MAPFCFWASPGYPHSPATPVSYGSGKDASTPLQSKPRHPTSLLDVAGQVLRSPALASALQASAHAGPHSLTAAFWHALEGPLRRHLITSPAGTSQGPAQDNHELGSHVLQLLMNLSAPPCSLSATLAEDISHIASAALHAINALPLSKAAQEAFAARHARKNPAAGVFFESAVQALNNILSMKASLPLPTHPDGAGYDVHAHDSLLQTPSPDKAAPAQKQAVPQTPQENGTREWDSFSNLDTIFDHDSLSPETSLPGGSDIGSTINEMFDFPDTLQGDVDSTPIDFETILDGDDCPEDHQQPQHHVQMPIDLTTDECAPTQRDLMHTPMDGSTDVILESASPMQDSPDVLLSSHVPSQDSPSPLSPSSQAFLREIAAEMDSMSPEEFLGIDPATDLLFQAEFARDATWASPSLMQAPGAAADSLNASTAAPSAGFDCFHTQQPASTQHKRVPKPAHSTSAFLGPNKPIKKAANYKRAGASRKGSAAAPRRCKPGRDTQDPSESPLPRKDLLEADMMAYIQNANIVGPTSAAQGSSRVPLHRVSCCMLQYPDVHAGFECPGMCTTSSLLGGVMWTACTVSLMRRVDDCRTSVSLRGLQRHVLHLVISLYSDAVSTSC